MFDELTREEALGMLKAITAYNDGVLEFNTKYVKYANTLDLQVIRSEDTLVLSTPGLMVGN